MINNTPIKILLDTGATNNFINERLVKDLNIDKIMIKEKSVQFGNSSTINIRHKININLNIEQIPDISFIENLYVIPDLNIDMIFCIEWMHNNKVCIDFDNKL
ncbi:DNA damage-inducible protein 1 [Dictyocoela muelleri]|nr:DNA damage-inducible protein 1 [Dictyocoela muelleri]